MGMTGCPDRAELEGFAFGSLPEPVLVRVAGHVERCAACEATLQALDPLGDPLLSQLRRLNGPDGLEAAERFLREARSAAQLDHPGIISLHETGQADDGTFYLVEEFVPGRTLASVLGDRERPLAFGQAAELIAAVADALDYAHRHGVIHRDIKPSNILLDAEGRPHLMDF